MTSPPATRGSFNFVVTPGLSIPTAYSSKSATLSKFALMTTVFESLLTTNAKTFWPKTIGGFNFVEPPVPSIFTE